LYCGLSLLWENPALRESPTTISRFVLELVEMGAIEAISQHPSVEEFVETRRELYKHDQARYPLYYEIKNIGSWPGPTATRVKESSATRDLSVQLDSWAQGGTERVFDAREAPSILRRAVRTALTDREDRAITFALFRPFLAAGGMASPRAEYAVRRQISRGYTSHYMAYAFGDLPTGVPGLSFFDPLSKAFPDYDVELLGYLISLCGMSDMLKGPLRGGHAGWLAFAAKRRSDFLFELSSANLRLILRTLYLFVFQELGARLGPQDDLFGIRAAMKMAMRSYLRPIYGSSKTASSDYVSDLAMSSSALLRTVEHSQELRKAYDQANAQMGAKTPRILIATATTLERDTVLRIARGIIGSEALPEFGPRRGYFRLGTVGGVDIFLVQCEMGSVGPGASLATIGDALDDIKPIGVIMVGIAFGVDETRQNIGEIIVAKQLQNYELARIGTDKTGQRTVVPRGDRVTASTLMLSRMRIAEAGWTGRKVRFGLLLSGEKLIDNFDYREELRQVFPEAEGGEMEGAGLYTAAADRNVNWTIVKAICDWADGNKNKNKARRQVIAAEQAVSFVFRALQQGGFQTMNPSGRVSGT
jgi:nucleoside phosphorylase